ncbi:MAG TPA: ornithine cyclodeaminase family protein [Citreicella sp.]|jgi:ornithine cyclodeaminase/alanine dehydrogenase-like protein (mu-crystallin family)|nr:ornithine cyclodeaminase family protein [Citreicella sp.]|tara:strand:+ start:27 stop:1019 length:993 start_codon:yes stop_codon:yes gene_type:complete
MATLLLTKAQVRQLLRMTDVITAVEAAFRAFNSDQVAQPDYMGLHLQPKGAEIDFKAALDRAGQMVSLKASSGGFRDNPAQFGLPNGMGTVLLFDARNGALVCAMDGSLLTGYRTGAAGAVSARALARRDARRVGVIGTGTQARMQIRALREVLQIETVHAASRSAEGLASFCAEMQEAFGLTVLPGSPQEVAEAADILITTTRATGVVVHAGWVRPGTHVIAVGADQAGKQELDPELFHGARIVVDSFAQCAAKGDLQHALRHGTAEGPQTELGEILLGQQPGRSDDAQITIFDSTGMAIQDTATASALLSRARAQGIGTLFDFLGQGS